jgi:serine/threonine protein phosphatase PrpC
MAFSLQVNFGTIEVTVWDSIRSLFGWAREEPPPQDWRVFGATVKGASHERLGLPNQDALGWEPMPGIGPPLLLAVADGHGSSKCFRSDVGSKLAVKSALGVLNEFLESQLDLSDLVAAESLFEEELPREIERRWKESVEEDLEENPLTEDELTKLEETSGESAREKIEGAPFLVYGATILAAVIHESFIACLQLGDGDILVVSSGGEVACPIPGDDRLIANETTSLSGEDAWSDFRASFQAWTDLPPELVLLATDGYSNSFGNDADFLSVGSDLLGLLCSEGLESVNAELPTWLEETSRDGSGDDVTAGIFFRTTAATDPEPLPGDGSSDSAE